LSHFKEVNGFERVDLPRYYIPLTRLGQIGFRFGLHRMFVEHMPEPIAARLRDFRRMWHGHKLQQPTEA
jgi:hypothetical protein